MNDTRKTISICIPTYEMRGVGYVFLERSFKKLTTQTFKNFDVVVSDHSKDDHIKNLCEKYKDLLDIHYYRNSEDRGSMSMNTNNAIKKAGGTLIKILFQDDFLFHDQSLEEIVQNFDVEKDHWLVTGCIQTQDGVNFFNEFFPKYNKYIYLGKNTISTPSVLTIKNEDVLFFDKNLLYFMDCDYYKRCYDTFGSPKIVNKVNVAVGIGDHQTTHTLVNRFTKLKELTYSLIKNIVRSLKH